MPTTQDSTYPNRNNSLSIAAMVLSGIAVILSALALYKNSDTTARTQEQSLVIQRQTISPSPNSMLTDVMRQLSNLRGSLATNSADSQVQAQQEVSKLRATLRNQYQDSDVQSRLS